MMKNKQYSIDEITELQNKLREAEEILAAIRSGEIDAFVIENNKKQRILTLKGADQPYQALVEAMSEGALTLTTDGTIIYCNRCFTKMIGKEHSKIIGKKFYRYFNLDEQADIKNLLKVPDPKPHTREFILNTAHHVQKTVYLSPHLIHLDSGEDYISLVVTDISELKKNIIQRMHAEERLQFLISHDILTGLANRNLLTKFITKAIQKAKKNKEYVGILLVNLDRFNKINDTLGYDIGDHLLQVIAKQLEKNIQDEGKVARIGSDEFVIVLTQKNVNAIVAKAKYILEGFEKKIICVNQEIKLTASIGISIYPQHGDNEKTLLMNAAIALHQAKELGRNTIQICTEEMATKTKERLNLEKELYDAFINNKLEVYYQPKAELKTGLIYGVEALLRWECSKDTFVSPTKFIPLAESMGLIDSLGEWVLRTACKDYQQWLQEGIHLNSIAINLSAIQLKENKIIHVVQTLLQEINIDPACLEFEITESILIPDIPIPISILNQLKQLGITLSIDDFGTGYASLNYLKRFNVDKIKIDRSFITGIGQDFYSEAIIIAMISIAHSLKIKVLAEGVETKAQIEFLKKHHCDEIQGFYVTKALPSKELMQFIRENSQINFN